MQGASGGIVPRSRTLTPAQLDLLLQGDLQEQRALLWLAICKRYAFIREFAVEVLRVKFERMDYCLTEADYDLFYRRKAIAHPEPGLIWRPRRTQGAKRSVQNAARGGPDHRGARIVPAILSARLREVSAPDAPAAWLIYPMPLP